DLPEIGGILDVQRVVDDDQVSPTPFNDFLILGRSQSALFVFALGSQDLDAKRSKQTRSTKVTIEARCDERRDKRALLGDLQLTLAVLAADSLAVLLAQLRLEFAHDLSAT